MDFAEFRRNETSIHTVLHNLIILGEASNHIPSDIQDVMPNLPWASMRDLRNLLIHEYFRVNLTIIWNIVTVELPTLSLSLALLLQDDDQSREDQSSSISSGSE